jgi:hypothetical protein
MSARAASSTDTTCHGRHRRAAPAWHGSRPPRRLASRMVPPAPNARPCCAVAASSKRVSGAAVAPFRKDESEGVGAEVLRSPCSPGTALILTTDGLRRDGYRHTSSLWSSSRRLLRSRSRKNSSIRIPEAEFPDWPIGRLAIIFAVRGGNLP